MCNVHATVHVMSCYCPIVLLGGSWHKGCEKYAITNSLWLVHSANCSVFQRNLFTPCKVACETRKCGYFCGGTCNGSSIPPQKKHMINHLKIICCIRGCSAQPRKNGATWLGESIFNYEYLHEFEAKIETARKLA
jgi:hypothetical protein